ncbi:MAG: hypothetical protein M3461_00245, partial [Pseudomonadota bacterium]|nr:hypothetical protein [Pseudomonadota bacterium]
RRSAALLPADLGRADRCPGGRGLVQRGLYHLLRVQPPHDPHPRPLRSPLMGAEGELALRWTTFREEFWVTFRCQTYWLLATPAAWRVLWHLPRTGRFEPNQDRPRRARRDRRRPPRP